jgi:hypothetical protein
MGAQGVQGAQRPKMAVSGARAVSQMAAMVSNLNAKNKEFQASHGRRRHSLMPQPLFGRR